MIKLDEIRRDSWLWGTRIQDLNQFSQEYRKNSEVFRSIQNNSEQFRTIQTEFRQYLEVPELPSHVAVPCGRPMWPT